MFSFSPDKCHTQVIENLKPELAFDPNANYAEWKEKVREKFGELLGDDMDPTPLNVTVEYEKETDEYIEKRIIFDTEPGASVPCHLRIPKGKQGPHPVVICLQGHSSGMHISLGNPIYPGDEEDIAGGDRDFARQIIREGYAALTVEQRDMGERKCHPSIMKGNTTCEHSSMVALLIGRTMVKERAWDISRAIDMLETMPEIDKDHIALMGNSGGGTTTYYATALEPRIKVAMPSCAVCSFDRSIAFLRHCDCNYIPKMLKYFDMGEIAALIAPRPLIIIAGEKDYGFKIDGTKKVYSVIEQIYEKENAADNCKLIVGPEGHRFYADLSWDTFRKYFIG